LSFEGNNFITSGTGCSTYYFDVPSVGTDDLMIYVSNPNLNQFDIYIYRSEGYSGNNPTADYNFQGTGNQTFLIPNCLVSSISKWYINVGSAANVNGTMSFSLVTGTPIPQSSNEISGTLTLPNRWFYGQFNPTGASTGVQVSFSISTTLDTYTSFYVNLGTCPTQAQTTSYNPYLNTEAPNEPIYFAIFSGFFISPIDFNVSIITEPTQCKTPQGMKICSQYVDWQSTVWNSTIVSQQESLIEFVLLVEKPQGSCINVFTEFLCIELFPKCNSNGFPLLPCSSDCTTFEKNCESYLNGGNCSDVSYPTGVQTYCYLGSSSYLLPSVFLFLSLIIFSF